MRKKLELTPSEFAKLFGISKSSLYLRLNGKKQWTLLELIKLCELAEGEIDIQVGEKTYKVLVQKKVA